jgi:hypothetical protein
MDVIIQGEDCPPCTEPCGEDGNYYHDACACTPGLQVKPIIGSTVTVGYFAVVTDPNGVGTVSHVYADVWHPDGTFKYQIELFPIGFDTYGDYYNTEALAAWAHVTGNHSDLITINSDWAATLPPGITAEDDIYDELWQDLAYLYYGEAEISYCQPGGYYYVGVRGHDTYNTWCNYLYNTFWYIPTSAVELDFNSLNYGTVTIPSSSPTWVGGDSDMLTSLKPTAKNIGNTPVELYVWQDDMDFSDTNGAWNVMFDARLGPPNGNPAVYYSPYDFVDNGLPETDPNYFAWPGVQIPGILPLCTENKLDFSIHAYKGMPGLTYSGIMKLFAFIDCDSYVWGTPAQFQGNAPLGVPPTNSP